MNFRTSSQLLGALALLVLSPAESFAIPLGSADSLSLHSRARSAQGDFERLRSSYAPVLYGASSGSCDEVIGRMCLRYLSGLPEDWVPPPEHRRVQEGRQELIDLLSMIGDSLPGDRWVRGQRIAYLGEAGEWSDAHEVALDCQVERWWCFALRGLTYHHLGAIEKAEEAFAAALGEMPAALAAAWEEVTPLIDQRFEPILRNLQADSLGPLLERLWVLADPLYLQEGNDVRTAHYARHTLAAIRSEGDNPYGFRWGDDLHEIFVRYGPEVAYQQIGPLRPGVLPIPLVGRFDPAARGFFPTPPHFLAPKDVPPGEWRTDARSVRSRHTPNGAARIGGINVQQARFRRGDELLLILGWQVAEGVPHWEEEEGQEDGQGEGDAEGVAEEQPQQEQVAGAGDRTPGDPVPEELRAGLFLLPLDGALGETQLRYSVEPILEEGASPQGVVTALIPFGAYLLSMELLDSARERGWRARHGVDSSPLAPGAVALSDLILLSPGLPDGREGAPSDLPDALELHLGRVLPSLTIESDSVEVAWEIYGVGREVGIARFTLSVSSEERGGLRRALEFFRLTSPATPVEMSWEEDLGRDMDSLSGGRIFRRLALNLSQLSLGQSTVRIEMHLPGREVVVSELGIQRLQARQ